MENAEKAKVIEFIDKDTEGVIYRVSDPAVVEWLDTKSGLVDAIKDTRGGFQGGTVRVPIGGFLPANDIRHLVKLLQKKKPTYKNGVMKLNNEVVDANHLAQILAYLSVPEEDIIGILEPVMLRSNTNTTYTSAENRINQMMAAREAWLRRNAQLRHLISKGAYLRPRNDYEYPFAKHTLNMSGAEFEKYLRTEAGTEKNISGNNIEPYPKLEPLPKAQRNRNNYSNVIGVGSLFGPNEGGRRRVRKTRKGCSARKGRKSRKNY